jgi:hypothetical protein
MQKASSIRNELVPFFVRWLTVHIIGGPIILEPWIVYTLPEEK